MSRIHSSRVIRQTAPTSASSSADARSTAVTTRRPIGISMLAVAAAAIGVAALIEAEAWFGATDIEAGSLLAAVAGIVGLVLVIVATLEFVFAYGAWGLRTWATRLGTGTTVTTVALTLISAGRGSYGAHTLSLLLEIGTVWYLLSPRVQATFRSHAGRGA